MRKISKKNHKKQLFDKYNSSNGILKKVFKFMMSVKNKSKRNNILDKLVLTIYRLENSNHI